VLSSEQGMSRPGPHERYSGQKTVGGYDLPLFSFAPSFWLPQSKRSEVKLERVQWKVTDMLRGLQQRERG